MRKSKMWPKMQSGEVVKCAMLHSNDHRLVELACISGLDCLWICNEHTANDWSKIETMILAAKAHDTDILIRTERGSYSQLIKPIELDATGIIIPHCMSYEDAKEIQKITRFAPIGLRPLNSIGADSDYLTTGLNDYIDHANSEKKVVVMIEDIEVVPDIERICALDGIDMLLYGPGDYSQSVGDIGNFTTNREVLDLYEQIPKLAAKHGKMAGVVCSWDNCGDLIDMGYNFLNIAVDLVGLGSYYRDSIEKFNAITDSRK